MWIDVSVFSILTIEIGILLDQLHFKIISTSEELKKDNYNLVPVSYQGINHNARKLGWAGAFRPDRVCF